MEEKALRIVRELGVARRADVEKRGVHHEYLSLLVEKGLLQRLSRGIYAPAGLHESSMSNLDEAAIMVPHGVACLLSALNHYEVGTQSPAHTWMAISRRARMPQNVPGWIKLVRFSEVTFDLGIERPEELRDKTRVYSLGRTVIDCFKYRRLVGLDVAMEALQDVRRRRLVGPGELADWAERLGVSKVVRPYLEAIG